MMEGITHKIFRYAGKALMTAFMITTLSCERDLFLTGDEGRYSSRTVNLTIAYELPEHDQNAITRSIAANDEYKLNNFYLMVFGKKDGSEGYTCVYKHFYKDAEDTSDRMDFDSKKGEWKSIENKYNKDSGADPEDLNTTCGYVTVEAEFIPEYGCYIYGFANVDPLDGDTPPYSTVDAMAIDGVNRITPRAMLDKIKTIDELKAMKIEVTNLNPSTNEGGETIVAGGAVNRENPNLLYSGQWSTWLPKRWGEDGKKHIVFDEAALTGQVTSAVLEKSRVGNNYDLRSQGMIYLRTTIAHVRFNITYNNTVFKDFKPESWQVVHAPLHAYYIDDADHTRMNLSGEDNFGKTEPVKHMLHDEAIFSFDFYMMENIKRAMSTDEIDYTGSDKQGIINYYNGYFGRTVSDNQPYFGDDVSSTDYQPSKQKLIYGTIYGGEGSSANQPEYFDGDDDVSVLVRYAKREMELKHTSDSSIDKNQLILNKVSEGYNYESKKYVYSEPKATYVVIKGRLLIKDGADGLQNLLEPVYDANGDLVGTQISGDDLSVKNAYADVTYTIHLGYAKKAPEGEITNASQWASQPYDPADFSILRNAEYTYNIHIAGINSIITNVVSTRSLFKKENDDSELFRVKPQTNAEGNLSLSVNKVFDTDAHFNQFNFMLEKEGLSDFYFEIHTPWSVITTDDVKADIDRVKVAMGLGNIVDGVFVPGPDYGTKYGDFAGGLYKDENLYPAAYAIYQNYVGNLDFTWFKFTPAYDQRGMFDEAWSEIVEDGYAEDRKTVKYDSSSPTLWNLFDFMVSMDALINSDNPHPDYNENEVAIQKRINNTLYGNDTGDKASSTTVFECEVDDANGDYEYTRATNNALPFLLDRETYQLVQNGPGVTNGTGPGTPAEQYAYLSTQYENNKDKSIGQTGFYYKFKRPYQKVDGTYWVEEDYIQYLKQTDSATFGSNEQLGRIRRMFYTAYLDEYFYSEPPRGVTWPNDKPYWTQFVNKPSRYINFGYKVAGRDSEVGTQYSSDGQSSFIYSATTIIQPSIQTFYSTEATADYTPKYALGVEHYNETYDPRWKDGINTNTIKTTGLSHTDGWANAKQYVVYKDYPNDWPKTDGKYTVWDTYVSETQYEDHNSINKDKNNYRIPNNVTMRYKNDAEMTVNDRMGAGGGLDNKLAYLAGAIRMCMNRNRDEDGNGKIDEDELKWYLPASDQMDMIALCHYSLSDPLFDHNKFFREGYSSDINHQRLPEEYLRGQYLYKYHFVTSDYNIYASEEFMNASEYKTATENYASHPYDMRCVRNLNEGVNKVDMPDSYDDVEIYTFKRKGEDGNTVSTFSIDKLDSYSTRRNIVISSELPLHYSFSTDNLPYKHFQVATINARLISDVASRLTNRVLKNILDLEPLSPCHYYYEQSTEEIGSWRAPNAAEMGLMLMELRTRTNTSGLVPEISVDDGGPLFFWTDGSYYPQSSTSWNFTGPWGRVLGFKNGGSGWDITHTNIHNLDDPWANKPNYEEFSDQSTSPNKIFIRCVRDLSDADYAALTTH